MIDQLPFLHIGILFYLLSGQTYLINTFLMPTLENISTKYKYTQTGTGVLVALGISIPELTTNLLSCASFKNEMIGYGFGAIVGSGVFDFTVCFGIMSLFSFYHHKKSIKLNIRVLLRDIYIYLATLLYLALVFWDYEISLSESIILTLFYPVYLIYSSNQQSDEDNFDSSLVNQNSTNSSALKFAYDKFKHFVDEEEEDLEGEQIGIEVQQKIVDDQIPMLLVPFHQLFRATIPIDRSPELSFAIITAYCFLMVKFSIDTVDEVVTVLEVGHAFVGLTIASWAGNISDILNASMAAKNKKTELATSSIIGSQIMNLQVCLGLPWALTILYQKKSIVFYDEAIFVSIIAIFLVVLCSLFLILFNRLLLSQALGIELLVIYIGYFFFEMENNCFN